MAKKMSPFIMPPSKYAIPSQRPPKHTATMAMIQRDNHEPSLREAIPSSRSTMGRLVMSRIHFQAPAARAAN